MSRKYVFLLVLLMGLCSRGFAATLDPLPGWVGAQHIDKAVELAKKKDCPIVLLLGPKEGRGVLTARSYMRHPGIKGMVKVLIIQSARLPGIFDRVSGQVQEPDRDIPVMYIATPELRILAFVQSGSNRKAVHRTTEIAKKAMAWINKSKADIEAAQASAEAGRFGAALKTYQNIAEEDKERAVLAHSTWNVALTRDEVTHFYFPEMGDKIDGLTSMAEARLGKAKEAFEKKDYEEAKKLLAPMARDKCDLEPVKEACELYKKVLEAGN